MFLCYLILPNLFFFICSFYCYVFGRLVKFPNLGEVPFVGEVLCIQAAHSCLVTRAMCSSGTPERGALVLCCGGLTTLSGLMGAAGPRSH